MNQGLGIQSRRLVSCGGISERIEEIFSKISSLHEGKKVKVGGQGGKRDVKRKNRKTGKDYSGMLPVLTFTRTPVLRKCKEGSLEAVKSNRKLGNESLALVQINKHHGKSLLAKASCLTETSPTASPSLNISKLPLRANPLNEKYKKILSMTQKMISKDDLRGWSRN